MTIKADGGKYFSGIAGCLSVLPGKRTDGYLWERTGIFLYEDPVVQFHGADLQSAGPKLRKSLREETFVFLLGKFSEYRKNPYLGNGLKGRYLRIATPALCGICGEPSADAGREGYRIENGGQRKGEKYADIGSNGHL